MTISSLSSHVAPLATPTGGPTITKQDPQAAGSSFTERLGGAIDSLAESQNKATEAATAYEMGQQQDLAAVMIEQQVASLGFQLALNIRNKAISAYRDIMNMSV